MQGDANGDMMLFQSTLPVWGATSRFDTIVVDSGISIHAPRVGSDSKIISGLQGLQHFNPRSPCGERPHCLTSRKFKSMYFNPRSPCGERLFLAENCHFPVRISIHAPRVGSDI